MKIEIFGTGCRKCKKLERNVETAVKELDLKVNIEKVRDINEIASRGVMMTPAIAVDGEVKASGKLLSPEDIKKLLK